MTASPIDVIASTRVTGTTRATIDRVWAALTTPDGTSEHLWGLAVHSAWQIGGPVSLHWQGRPMVTGDVLAVDRPHLLAYCLNDPSGTTTYLSWRLSSTPTGCDVQLTVDETDGTDDDTTAAARWRAVLGRLTDNLIDPGATSLERPVQ